MEDAELIRLYWCRDEMAIPATVEAYGAYCLAIAINILGSHEDAEECVNDTWLRAWQSIPPHRPEKLRTFLGKITRNLALNRYRHNTAGKRGGGECTAVLEEIAAFTPTVDCTAQSFAQRELADTVDTFLAALTSEQRIIFVRRYWYFDSVADIAARLGKRENSVAVTLSRLRAKLRQYLEERGYDL